MTDRIYDIGSYLSDFESSDFVTGTLDNLSVIGAWAEHHIIPKTLLKGKLDPEIYDETRTFLKLLTEKGLFSIRDGYQNLINLPQTQQAANATRYALETSVDGIGVHGIDHNPYIESVNDWLGEIRRNCDLSGTEEQNLANLKLAARRVAGLQGWLREQLSPHFDPSGKLEHAQFKLVTVTPHLII